MPGYIRMVDAEYSLTREAMEDTEGYEDAVYMATCDAIPGIRAMGQAAGTAAALYALKAVTPRKLQVGELQKTLKEQKVILEVLVHGWNPARWNRCNYVRYGIQWPINEESPDKS